MAPWPNRIGDGRYTWDGQEIQAPINEVERNTALHGGVVSFQTFEAVSEQADVLELRTEIFASPGYPLPPGAAGAILPRCGEGGWRPS